VTRARTAAWLTGVCLLAAAAAASAQRPTLAAPNATGVSMGHLHYRVRDVAANARFWMALGGRPRAAGGREILAFRDVLVFVERGESSGGTDGSVLNHVAFRVPSFTAVEAAGLAVTRLAQFPGVGYVNTPEGERIELFENAATNLTFTPDAGSPDEVTGRHNRPLAEPIAFHHVHLYVPDAEAARAAKAWYARVFGGVPGKRAQYDATDLPGINLNFSAAPRPAAPTKGRMLDHLGLEVVNLAAFCRRLEGMGVVFDERYAKGPDGTARASFTDPWGTSIELTEGLAGL